MKRQITLSTLTWAAVLILSEDCVYAQFLANPSFEEGNSLRSEMAGWTRCGDHPEWMEVFVRHAGIEPRTGNYCIGSYSGVHRTRWGGAYQKVDGLKPGYRYRASVWFFTDSYDSSRDPHRVENNCRCRLGLDPAAGEELKADTVVWSHPVCTKGHKWEAEYWPHSHRRWSKLEVEAIAQSESATFFVETAQLFGYDYKLNLFDDADLEEIPVAMEVTEKYAPSEPSQITLSVRIANRDESPVNGSLAIELPEGLSVQPRSFAQLGREPQVFEFALATGTVNPGLHEARTMVKVDSGKEYRRRFRFHVPLAGHQAAKAIAIDGQLNDWPRMRAGVISKGQPGDTASARDCRARVWCQWDEDMLYVAASVEDDDFRQEHASEKAYSQDSLDILVDALNDAPVHPTPPRIRHGWGPNDHDFLVALTPDGPRAWRWKDVGVTYFHGEPEPTVQTKILRKGTHTVYEVAIPWETLSDVQPGCGRVLGIDVAVNDADEGRNWKAIGLSDAICGNAYRRPHNCVDLILTDVDGKAEKIPISIVMNDEFPM